MLVFLGVNYLLSNVIYFPFPVPPLFVIEFLHRVMDIFEDYFSECTESTIKENYVIVYEVRCIQSCSVFFKTVDCLNL